jgi:hypothetical protein
LTDASWFKLLFWGLIIAMIIHLALIVAIAGIAK